MAFNAAFNEIIILFIIMFLGFLAKKFKMIHDQVQNTISTLLVQIGMPALVISSANFERNTEVMRNMIHIVLISIISYILIILLMVFMSKTMRLPKQKANAFISLIVFANVGFMGYPISKALFQEAGVFYASLVNLVFTSFLWTYGVLLYNKSEKLNLKKLFNIGTISSFIAILLFVFNIRLPYVVQAAMELTGKMTTPLAMLLIGSLISDISLKALFTDYLIFFISFIRLLLLPLATAIILKFLNFNSTVISFCAIIAAMPAGATNAIFAKEFDCEPEFSSVGVFMTTLLSIFSIPAVLFILTYFINT